HVQVMRSGSEHVASPGRKEASCTSVARPMTDRSAYAVPSSTRTALHCAASVPPGPDGSVAGPGPAATLTQADRPAKTSERRAPDGPVGLGRTAAGRVRVPALAVRPAPALAGRDLRVVRLPTCVLVPRPAHRRRSALPGAVHRRTPPLGRRTPW